MDRYNQIHLWIGSNFEKELPLEDILPFSSIDRSEWGKIKLLCNDLGIYQANALFWYADAELTIPTPYKDSYNGLKYIGVFQGD